MKGGSGAALALGGFLLLGGYAVASFGGILLRGYDIPLRARVSPLHPYSWQGFKASVNTIPPTQIFPTGSSAGGVEGTVPGGLSGAGGKNPGPAAGGAVLG